MCMTGETIKIGPNKKRVPPLLVAGAIFTIITVLLLRIGTDNEPEQLTDRIIDSLILIIPLFYTSVGLVDFLRTLFDPNTALFITPKGIDDNLSTMSCGEIKWNEITGVEVNRVLNLNVLVVKLVNPETVINRQGFIKRKLLMRYAKRGRSPVIISEKRINYDIFELKRLLAERLGQS